MKKEKKTNKAFFIKNVKELKIKNNFFCKIDKNDPISLDFPKSV